ncbi:OmpA family protein [Rhodobacteraceae bacterium CCMM004]|nr:OmpA family protein [Rhodobacteraceae bacterium CCMM004]
MRLNALLPSLICIAAAAGASVYAASVAVTEIERRSVQDVDGALDAEGHTWADVTADGLQVHLQGTAPDEATRFRVLSVAGERVDPARVIDAMAVAQQEPVAPPRFAIEMLRGDDGISLIGLIPASLDRQALMEDVARVAFETPITDLLETAPFPPPDGWDAAFAFAVEALGDLERSKISIAADRVSIKTMAESEAEKRAWETRLARAAPDGVELGLDIAAPRPVITPFTLRFVIDGDGARFDACSAATETGKRAILASASGAGAPRDADCTIGLGVPGPDWPAAASAGIEAVAELGAGSITLSDADVVLTAVQGTDETAFDTAVATLQAALPEGFSLTANLPKPEAAEGALAPAEFVATRSPEGQVQLRGRVADPRAHTALETFAKSLFGVDTVSNGTRVNDAVPDGWSPRLLAGLSALSLLHNGAVTVTETAVEISGTSGNAEARSEIARLLSPQLDETVSMDIRVNYDKTLDPLLGLPTPEECVAQINQAVRAKKITFDPGAATIDAEARETLDRIAELMRTCEDVRMEIAGYTDSQGRESMNLELSQARAEAVLTALAARRVLTGNLIAKGYGEADPIADNGTEEGREANRRIEFTMIPPEPEEETAAADAPADETPAQDTEDDGDGAEEAAE